MVIRETGRNLDIDEKIIKNIPEYKYLRRTLTDDGIDRKYIQLNSQLKSVLWNKTYER